MDARMRAARCLRGGDASACRRSTSAPWLPVPRRARVRRECSRPSTGRWDSDGARLPVLRENGRAHAAIERDVAQADAGAVHGIGWGNGGTYPAVALGVQALHVAIDEMGGAGGKAKAG